MIVAREMKSIGLFMVAICLFLVWSPSARAEVDDAAAVRKLDELAQGGFTAFDQAMSSQSYEMARTALVGLEKELMSQPAISPRVSRRLNELNEGIHFRRAQWSDTLSAVDDKTTVLDFKTIVPQELPSELGFVTPRSVPLCEALEELESRDKSWVDQLVNQQLINQLKQRAHEKRHVALHSRFLRICKPENL